MLLPVEKAERAARRAIEINPANAADMRSVTRSAGGASGGPRRIAIVTARRWPASGVKLAVQFLDNPTKALRARLLSHMNAWGVSANVHFAETRETGEVRIARLDRPRSMAGYWSYIGTEILEADLDQPTMNLEGFTMRESEEEFRRVVRHEAGHTLGFDHEHMRADLVKRIDPAKAFKHYARTDGWSRQDVREQVLTPLDKRSIMGTTTSDPDSIMCYQIPAEITKNGVEIPGGLDINANDAAFAARLYPLVVAPVPRAVASRSTPVTQGAQTSPDDDTDAFHIVILDPFEHDGVPSTGNGASTPKFARVLATYGGARVTSTLQLRAGRGEPKTRFGKIIKTHQRIRNYTNRTGGTLPTEEEMVAFGGDLFETLFQGDVRRLYDEARARQRSRKLDLVLTSMIPWIAEKPWEFAFDTGRQSFLATEEIHFVRNVLTNVPSAPITPVDGALRILVAAAQPVGFGRLSADEEAAVISRGFASLVSDGLVTIDVMPRATPKSLQQALQTGHYHIVHFIGHGVYDETRNEGCLVFEDERGGSLMLGQRSVREIFGGRGLSLVFLNACESGKGGLSDFNKGVAQSLVAHGLPALVANQYSVLDSSASSFAQHFYWSLAHGRSLGDSAREARIAVNYSYHGELIDWAIPVLYARDANRALCTPRGANIGRAMTRGADATRATDASTVSAPSQVTRGARRRRTARAVKVAVWDMDGVFPALRETLVKMTAAQTHFAFELADLSVPLDIWDLETDKARPYLVAERLARRLQGKSVELGVHLVACVTRHWMRDATELNRFGWWPDDRKPPVIIFSAAGFDALKPQGSTTDRVIANVMVSGLAGFYGQLGTHVTGAKSCPLSHNPGRDFRAISGKKKFDRACRAKLAAADSVTTQALEALLTMSVT